MKFFDLESLENDAVIETDLCIVGGGPAGLSIAKEFAGTNVDVWILESGGLQEESATQALYDIESVSTPRIIDQEKVRQRIFGGSSHTWTGRCAPFDEMDYQYRAWVPYSGWSLTPQDVEPYLERAGNNLGLGPNCYNEKLWKLFDTSRPNHSTDERLLKSTFWQFSKGGINPREPVRFGRDLILKDARNINILLHANVTHINTNSQGTCFQSVAIRTLEGKYARVKAKVLVLCCGGIENARLLLASNRTVPQGVGNPYDTVGRFLMDHPLAIIGQFDAKSADKVRDYFGHYWVDDEKGRHVYLHGLSLGKEVQHKEKLLRCDAFLEEFDLSPDDPWVVLNQFRQSLQSKSITPQVYRDAKTLVKQTGEIARGMYRRQIRHRPQLQRKGRIELHCMLEQLPDPNSRVTLSKTQKDALGMPISTIDWKISELERQTVRRTGQLIVQEFQRLGLPTPQLSSWLNDDTDWKNHFAEKAHPSGTTRMSTDPKMGVVDSNCQVHGVEGLFVAGSSVFPTSGTANPTLMILALAVRLADHLKGSYFQPQSSTKSTRQLTPLVTANS